MRASHAHWIRFLDPFDIEYQRLGNYGRILREKINRKHRIE